MATKYGTETVCSIEEIPKVIIVTPGKSRNNGLMESNELLATNSSEIVQMKEFDRVDSEDDILEEYGDCTIRTQCIRNRTGLEKCMAVFLVIFFILSLALIIAVSKKQDQTDKKAFCSTKDCIDAASSILGAMDQTANPCEDFYQYACGGWDKNTPIPPGYPVWDRFQELSYKNLHNLKDFLENLDARYSSGMKAKKFYSSCMLESKKKRQETMRDFFLLKQNTSKEDDFNFPVLLERVHLLNSWPLFSISVGPDERSSGSNVIKIDYSDAQYPFRNMQWPSTTPSPETTVSVGNSSSDVSYDSTVTKTTMSPQPPTVGPPTYLQWNSTEVEKNYMRETARIVKIFWNKTDAEATEITKKLLQLEKEIGMSRDSRDHTHNRSMAYNVIKVVTLQSKCSMIDWVMYFNRITSISSQTPVTLNTEIVALHEQGLLKICSLVNDYKKDTEKKKVLQYYLLIHLMRSMMPYFDANTFAEDLNQTEELEMEGEHWRRCVHYTNKAFGFVTGAMYVNGTSKTGSIKKMKQLVTDVKVAFKDYLLKKIWLDPNTRKNAEKKLEEMLEKISYPDYILKPSFLDKYYEMFNVDDDWFVSVKNMLSFRVMKIMENWGTKVNRKSWINPPVTEEADYSPVRNDIMFPIAMFHLPFYADDGPQALNFGAMGSVIGHEITHAFDITGRQYDGQGRLREWWEPLTAKDYAKTTSCMKSQYDKYKIDNYQVNGEKTLDENIADNGGLRAAYIAYQLWERQNGVSLPLPGVNLSDKQLFFVSFAQMFCSKWKESGLIANLIDDSHSPGPIRIRGAISNSNAFGGVFNCPYISGYSPSVKCEVW